MFTVSGAIGWIAAGAVPRFAILRATVACFARKREELLRGRTQLAAEVGDLVEQPTAQCKVVELHKRIAHLFICVLELLDLLLQSLDSIVLSIPIRPLCQPDLRPPPLPLCQNHAPILICCNK